MRVPVRPTLYLCVLLAAACAGDTDDGTAGNTELNLDIVSPGGTSGELGFSIDRVDYRITCASGSYVLPPYYINPLGAAGDPCSLADLDTNGIPDVCPPGSNYIAGTAGPNNIMGTNGADCIFGMGGNDVIQGGNGQDYICGGSGADDIDGGNAHDYLHGGDGDDIVNGGSNGGDTLLGGAGNDQLFGSTGNDLLIGGDGDDALDGDAGNDSLDGGLGVDTLDAAQGYDTCVEEVPGTSVRLTACESGYSDAVDISGAFETVDTRVPPVWQAVMDLPPGDCTITLSVYEDDEIVCVGSQTLVILEDGTTKYDIVLVCSLSVDLPDGMADVDGTFEFITGNLCPKLYVLNAIPRIPSYQFDGPFVGQKVSEIQYRAKDADNSCGSNCDPQTCTGDNPPVCTPYPSNINDPNCNPAFGGNPNAPECLAGDHAGLVCTLIAWGMYSGYPVGTFFNPLDGVTPVGPVLGVNLNTTSGIPGVILPGLGGPAGTNAANSPAYPPIPNVNGSLPPLRYACDNTTCDSVAITLTCSDGDAECDQNKVVIVECYCGPDWCIGDPIDCSASGECLTDGFCDNSCDPLGSCDRCPGKDIPLPPGTLCAEGGGNVCDGAGSCVECNADADCLPILPPADCQLDPICVGNTCVPGAVAPAGTACTNGVCDGSGIGSTDPPCVFQP